MILALWESAWQRGEVDALDSLLDSSYRRESTRSHRISDVAALKHEIRAVRAAFPDLVTTVDDIVVDADECRAVVYWTSVGTFAAPLHDVPPTGRRVETRGSNLVRFRDGVVLHERVTWDRTDLFADLGAPAIGSAFEDQQPTPSVTALSTPPKLTSPTTDLNMLKEFNRRFVSGVTVVTTLDDSQPRGLAVNAYASLSLEPPLVVVCIQKTSRSYPSLFRSTHIGINILSNRQRDTLGVFASRVPDKFAGVGWHGAPAGSPLLDGSSAAIEAEVKERFQAKTHTVFIARITHAECSDLAPLVYTAGRFFDGGNLTEL